MSVQFNLLPQVKLDYLKVQRSRNKIIGIAIMVSIISFGIFLLTFFSVSVIQRTQQKNLDGDIKTASGKLQSIQGLDQVLTVQNQLSSLVNLHQSKHITSRIFTYLPQLTPTNVQVGSLKLDLAANTMQLDGTANSQLAVNTFIDTLKFTTYTTPTDSTAKPAFPSVVLSSFSVAAGNSTYSLNVTFDPILFANTVADSAGKKAAPTLNVPKQTTTRSTLEDPTTLFTGQTKQSGGQ